MSRWNAYQYSYLKIDSAYVKKTVFALLLLIVNSTFSQLTHPKASPAATVIQEVGLTTITITYSRPTVRGRKIFGDLVPYGRIWRVGANASTKVTFDTPFNILGNHLPAGTYALYAFPEEHEWTIVFHKNLTHWGDGRKAYKAEEDAFRVKVKVVNTPTFQENFLISFDAITHNQAVMIWHWAHTRIEIPIEVATKATMEKQIATKLNEKPTAQTYYEVARYYVEQEMEYAKALTYLNKAIAMKGDTYYFYRVKSLAEAALKRYTAAISSAKKSLNLAAEQGKDEFVRMNQKSIVLWREKRRKAN